MLILRAHAKVNLLLNVGSLRPNGYHTLRTVFQEIALSDTLRFKTAVGGIRLTVSGSALPTGPENLVVRALKLLQKTLGADSGMRVHLTKRIPVGAGLGGGSSDA